MPILILLLLAVPVMACPDGCTVIDKQTCACEARDDSTYQPTKTSDEKPPQNQQLPWQTGEVKADMPPSLIASDSDADRAKQDADSDGKIAAHVPQ